MSVLVFARTGSLGRQAGGADPAGSRKANATIFILGFFMFPFVCLRALGEFAPRLGVLLRLRPAWSVRAKGEDESHTWYLKDGTQLSAFVSSVSQYVAANISAYCAVENADFQLRKLAPEALQPTEWQPMRKLSSAEKPADAGRDQNVFLAEPRLQPGKYLVSFRVLNRYVESQEFSGLTLIVS